eukprot:scaffold177479_cov20-Tisochrysis_lutea.AAC.2
MTQRFGGTNSKRAEGIGAIKDSGWQRTSCTSIHDHASHIQTHTHTPRQQQQEKRNAWATGPNARTLIRGPLPHEHTFSKQHVCACVVPLCTRYVPKLFMLGPKNPDVQSSGQRQRKGTEGKISLSDAPLQCPFSVQRNTDIDRRPAAKFYCGIKPHAQAYSSVAQYSKPCMAVAWKSSGILAEHRHSSPFRSNKMMGFSREGCSKGGSC